MRVMGCAKKVGLGLLLTLALSISFTFGCAGDEATPTPVEPTNSTPTVTPTPTSTPVEPTPIEQKVEIVIYTDFVCSNCARLHFEVETELIQRYVSTGKARLKVYLIATKGPGSLLAAQAALCASEQGQFLEYRHKIVTAWRELGDAAYSEDELRKAASELALNEAAFDACLHSPATLTRLQDHLYQSQEAGVDRVPTMFINGTKIVGIEPLETYVKLIEEQLAS